MRFLVDAQLPPALARMLSDSGHFAEHVTDIGLQGAPDSAIWEYAVEHEAVLVTKDGDFRDMLFLRGGPPVVVWVRLGNSRRDVLLAAVGGHLQRIVEHVQSGDLLIELR